MHPTWSILKVPDKIMGKMHTALVRYCYSFVVSQTHWTWTTISYCDDSLGHGAPVSQLVSCVLISSVCFPSSLDQQGDPWPELALLRLKSLNRKYERLLNAWLGIGTQLLLPSGLGRGRSHLPGQSQEPPTRSPCTEEWTSGASGSIYYKG